MAPQRNRGQCMDYSAGGYQHAHSGAATPLSLCRWYAAGLVIAPDGAGACNLMLGARSDVRGGLFSDSKAVVYLPTYITRARLRPVRQAVVWV